MTDLTPMTGFLFEYDGRQPKFDMFAINASEAAALASIPEPYRRGCTLVSSGAETLRAAQDFGCAPGGYKPMKGSD